MSIFFFKRPAGIGGCFFFFARWLHIVRVYNDYSAAVAVGSHVFDVSVVGDDGCRTRE